MSWCGCRDWVNPLVQLVETVSRRQYERRIAQIQRDVLRLEDRAVRDLNAFLAELRARTVADLALIPNDGGWPVHRLSALVTEIDQARVALAQRLALTLRDTTRQAYEIGTTAQASALALSTDQIMVSRAINANDLFLAQALYPDLVKRVSDDFRTRAAREITITVAGAQTPQQAMTKIAGLLKVEGVGGAGVIAAQAETVVRTEIMKVYAIADAIQHERIAADTPDIRKYWVATKDRRTREDHLEAWSRYRPGGSTGPIRVDEDFIVGGEKAKAPHDPRLSRKQVVRCRCVVNLWHPSWGN